MTHQKIRELLLGYDVFQDYYEDMYLNEGWTKEEILEHLFNEYKDRGMTYEEAEAIVDSWI